MITILLLAFVVTPWLLLGRYRFLADLTPRLEALGRRVQARRVRANVEPEVNG